MWNRFFSLVLLPQGYLLTIIYYKTTKFYQKHTYTKQRKNVLIITGFSVKNFPLKPIEGDIGIWNDLIVFVLCTLGFREDLRCLIICEQKKNSTYSFFVFKQKLKHLPWVSQTILWIAMSTVAQIGGF